MTNAKLSAKTIVSYTQVVKMVVASAVNENGDQIYPRVWNNDFVGIPIVDKTKQRRIYVMATTARVRTTTYFTNDHFNKTSENAGWSGRGVFQCIIPGNVDVDR